jgi:hypothetical protein
MSRIKIKQIQGIDNLSFYVKSSGNTINNVINALYTNTISATTYYNLPTDIFVSGGTYDNTIGVATFTNNTGGTFNVTGFSTGSSTFSGGTITGPTNFINGLTANTISATTYYNLPLDIRVTGGTYSNGSVTFTNNSGGTFNVNGFSSGTTIGNGTANYLTKWSGDTGLTNSIIRDDGTNIGIGTAPVTDNKVTIFTVSNNTYGLWVRNASNISGAKGIYGISNGNVGTQTGVWGVGEGHPTTGTSIGVDGNATDGLLGIGVRGTVGTSEFGSMTTGIGGYFDGRGGGEYGYPTNSYGLQVIDGTEGVDKILQSKTSDGKTNWVDPLTIQTAFNYGLANAIMTGNFLT